MPDTDTGPDGHETQLVAVFEHRQAADTAHDALLAAGIPSGAIELLDAQGDPAAAAPIDPHPGFWTALGRLFAPTDEAHRLSQAIGQGHVMIVVHPANAAERETAVEALESCGPLDLDSGRDPQAVAAPPPISKPARDHMVRIVEERMRVGWRDRPAAPGRVRQYVASKSQDRQRVQLHEEIIAPPAKADPV